MPRAMSDRRGIFGLVVVLLLAVSVLVKDSKMVYKLVPSATSTVSQTAVTATGSSPAFDESKSLRGSHDEITTSSSGNPDNASRPSAPSTGLDSTNEKETNKNPVENGAGITDQSAPVQPQTVQIPEDNVFSACMLTMDDNHFLLEWIPYHYHTLPLRDFIIAVDPNGHTSPSNIFDRWRRHGMMIEEWTDKDFMPPDVYDKSLWSNLTEQDKVDMHRQRQNHFQATCTKKLKARNRTWTLMIDSDEYLRLNHRKAKAENVPIPSMGDEGAIMSFLQKRNPPAPACIMVPRLRVGTIESSPKVNRTLLPSWVNRSSFQSLRFRRHFARKDINMHKTSKNILDVSRIDVKDMVVDNPHRTIKAVCPKEGLWTKVDESLYVVHHYLGTWEQFSSRNDARQGPGRSHHPGTYDMYKVADAPDSDDDSIQPWLEGFVNATGSAQAETLLKGVGVVGYEKR